MSAPDKKFCCSCTSRDSSFAIGILLTVFSSFSFLSSVRTTVHMFCMTSIEEYFGVPNVNIDFDFPISVRIFQAIVVALLIISLVQVYANVSLIVGVIKERASLVKVWLIFYKVLVTLVSIIFGVVTILCFFRMYNVLLGACVIIIGILHTFIAIYFIVVVGYHHKTLTENFTEFTNEYILELPRNGEKPLTPV